MSDFITFVNENSGVLSLLFSLVVAIATVSYVILTGKLVAETRRMRHAQSDPHVAVRVEPHESWLHITMLVIENVGPGPAYNVKLKVNPDFEIDPGHFLSEMGMFKHGIRYLGPGQRIRIFLASIMGQIDEIEKPDGKFRFSIDAAFENISSIKFEQTYPVDFLHMVGMSTIGKPPMQTIADDLEKLQKAVEKVQSGWSRLKVDVHTHTDRMREKEEHRKMHAAIIAESKARGKKNPPKVP